METYSTLLAFCAGNSSVTGWVNNGEAGDLRRHRTHYDVTVMAKFEFKMSLRGISLLQQAPDSSHYNGAMGAMASQITSLTIV